ncbi:MAG TPA: hypothetical protein DCO71_06985 [Gammaproteobacteria bacterium]|nr:hypothetical protein [Gammaproteobacteria bacterium]
MLALTGHGYGHLAQCAPVVNSLRQQLPELLLTVCSSLPHAVVAARIDREFDYRQTELDPVLRMLNAWEVDIAASRQVYREFHRNREQGCQHDIDLLEQLSPDLVLADIPWRILSAAAHCGIPGVGLCSLNWAAIYAAYCEDNSEDRDILEQMMNGYRAACLFLAPTPAIPMPDLDNVVTTGPIARRGSRQQAALLERCAVDGVTRAVLVALGGIVTSLPVDNWPHIEGVIWIFTDAVQSRRHDMVDSNALEMPFIDVLASVDVVLTKPGYGTYAEAVCNGVPVLTIARRDWPETAYLNSWVQQHGHLEVMTRAQFFSGDFVSQVNALLAKEPGPGIEPAGIQQAADQIRSLL